MAKIAQLSPHVADLIAAGEVVERPASVVKELLENAIDAGAKRITVEIQNGGMTFLRITDDGCGMAPEDAEIAFLRHATSKLRKKEDLEAIGTLGFRGEALAAIAAVSKIDLMTREAERPLGISLHLEAGKILSRREAGCPAGTTIIVRDLFYNTPARMKFMKRDSTEGAAVFAAVQKQAVAHPDIAMRFLRDGREDLSTSGDGKLLSAIYSVFGRQTALEMVELESKWEKTRVHGYISKPTASRGNRNYQIFFVNGRYVKSPLLSAALEEAYKNQMMTGRFPACVLELTMPLGAVDVNIHPAKTEVKFLNERDAYDCVYYGAMSSLNRLSGKVDAKLPTPPQPQPAAPAAMPVKRAAPPAAAKPIKREEPFFRTMSAEEFRTVMKAPPAAPNSAVVKEMLEELSRKPAEKGKEMPAPKQEKKEKPIAAKQEAPKQEKPAAAPPAPVEPEQTAMELPEAASYRIIGEAFDTYFMVEEGDELYLIDKHAAHERILFEKLRGNQTPIMSQTLVTPMACALAREEADAVLQHRDLLGRCGFGIEEGGNGDILLREIPADIDAADARESLSQLAARLQEGRRTEPEELRDELLHTVACKAAIKAGWHTDPIEREALVRQVLEREDLKYCPHGRPICVRLTKKQIERQFGRT
ncbi:MAG: DNA mismatch repair endonuclease MutL [Ruminococcaceae bacterium]|nr:DNA mismatch repair endonuclease MutL [Oscillospiraceae bacterium]